MPPPDEIGAISTQGLLTTQEVAKRIRHAIGTVENWRYQGKGPRWIKIAGKVLYPEKWLEDWMKEASCD